MRIVAVCGMGFGTSLMLKMNIDKILKKNSIKAEVLAWDLSSMKGQPADIVVTSRDVGRQLEGASSEVILIDNLTSIEEIESKLLPVVESLQE